MAANDLIFNLLQDCQLQVFTEKVVRYVLPEKASMFCGVPIANA